MRVLIIGGTGFIGTVLTQRFLKGGHEVSVLSRSQRPAGLDEEVGHIRASVESIRDSRKAILALRPDVIVHLEHGMKGWLFTHVDVETSGDGLELGLSHEHLLRRIP